MITAPVKLGQVSKPWYKCLVYGGTGVGKTILALRSQVYKSFVFDVDDGVISAKTYLRASGLRDDLIDVWPVNSFDEFDAGFKYLAAHLGQYQLAVVDTATELQQVLLGEIRKRAKVVVASQREWGMVLTQLEDIARWFRHVPLHVIWTAHETVKDDEQLRRPMFSPSFQGKFHEFGEKHFSEVWRYCVFEEQVTVEGADQRIELKLHRLLNCQRDQFTHAKDRSFSLLKYEYPDLDALFTKMIASANVAPGAHVG